MTGPLKDLRGQEYRSVHRDDAVVITGAEYLRKTMAEGERDRLRDLILAAVEHGTLTMALVAEAERIQGEAA